MNGPVTYGKIDDEIRDMKRMCRTVVRHFEGVRKVCFGVGWRKRVLSSLAKMEWTENELAVGKALGCLMGLGGLEVVEIRNRGRVQLRRVIDGVGKRNGNGGLVRFKRSS
jgi:hypothetical protein